MARINIDAAFFADPRLDALAHILGGDRDKAIGLCLRAWFLAQRYWGESRKLIPAKVWRVSGFAPLLEAELAEMRDDEVYCRGSQKHFEWYTQRIESGRRGGLASVEVRREKFGTAVPQNASNIEANPKHSFEAPPKQTEGPPNPPVTVIAIGSKEPNYSPNGERDRCRSRAPYANFLKIWNEHCGTLSSVRDLTEFRRRKIRARWGEKPDLAYWEDCVRKMAASTFICESGWGTFDWLTKNDNNHTKVAADNYVNRTTAAAGKSLFEQLGLTREKKNDDRT